MLSNRDCFIRYRQEKQVEHIIMHEQPLEHICMYSSYARKISRTQSLREQLVEHILRKEQQVL
jgi:hypothetical protein